MGVARHTIYNLAGSIAPMFVSIVTVPIYLHLVGDARYGVLALVWVFLGYFGLFNPGLSQAASYHIARLHHASAKEREDVFWTALAVNLGFGLAGGIILYFIARPFFLDAFKIPTALRMEVISSLPWLAASVPVSVAGGVLGGALQAREWFGVGNAINVANSAVSQIAPLAIAYWHGPNLNWLIPAILIARAFGTVPSFIAITRAMPLGAGGGFASSKLRELFAYGGWVSVTTILTPVLLSMDRVLIGSVLNAESVAFYSVPFNLVTRLTAIPAALCNSMFPRLSRASRHESGLLAGEAVLGLAAVMTPLVISLMVGLPILMKLWVDKDFAAHAAPVGAIILIGVWVNSLAGVPYWQLQAANRADLPAKFHLLELIPFIFFLWFGLHYFGLVGAAWAWTFRMTLDACLLFVVAGRIKGWPAALPGAVFVMIAPLCAPSTVISFRTLVAGVLLCLSIVWGWHVSPRIREASMMQIRRLVVMAS